MTPSGNGFFAHQLQVVREVHQVVLQSLDGKLLDELSLGKDRELASLSIHPGDHEMAMQFFLNIVVLVSQLETTIPIQPSFISLTSEGQQPTIWIDGLRNRGQIGWVGKLDARGLVAAGDRLVGSFKVVKVDIGLINVHRAGQIVG